MLPPLGYLDSQFGLDQVLYGALCLYFLARYVILRCFGRATFEWLHYVHVLYFCLICLGTAELVWFVGGLIEVIRASMGGEVRTGITLTCIIAMSPVALVATLVQGWRQSGRHISEIHRGVGALKHDRVLQIVCLPPIYGTCAMCALLELFHQVVHQSILGEGHTGVAFARYETCLLVADLYEAWALYQLGRLTFDVLHATLNNAGQRSRHGSARDVLLTFTAVSSLAWLGTWVFVLICIIQAGYSVYLWLGHDPTKDWVKYEAAMQKFSYAGLVAAGAAVYNVSTIGEVFGELLENFKPRQKFRVIMAIVTVAFWQLKVLLVLSTARRIVMPNVEVQHWEITSTIEVKMLHSALLIFECLACSTVNGIAWDHAEEWFEEKDLDGRIEEGGARAGERRPLLGGSPAKGVGKCPRRTTAA